MSVTDGSLTTDGAQQTVRIAGTVTTTGGGGSSTANQGTAAALASAWPIKLVDGSQNLASITNPANLTVGPALLVATGSQQAVTSLNAVSTGNGSTVDLGAARANVGMVITAGAGVSAGTVALETSHDGTNWFRSATTASTTAPGTYSLTATGAWRYARGVVTANITGGTVSSTIMGA